jgi:hypothetical protein
MRRMLMAVAATAAFGTLGLVAPASAQTAPVPTGKLVTALQSGELPTAYAQYRRYYGDPAYVERRYYGRPYYGRRYGYYPRGYYYRRDRGNALAAGALGLATGAIIGGAIAQQQRAPVYAAPNQSAVAYCAQRYRSYDPASGTYLGYDGQRHPCP